VGTAHLSSSTRVLQVRLGRGGIEEFLPLGPMNGLEQRNYDAMMEELAASIKKGLVFVASRKAAQ
jgi:malate/lactate dehydrogenase